jgi:hypothetical protein
VERANLTRPLAGSAVIGARTSNGAAIGAPIPSAFSRYAGYRNAGGFAYPYRGYGGGCWNCGFGFGLWPGWGFGWPLFGSWGLYSYSPYTYWDDPWLWGGSAYSYYAYPPSYSIYNDNTYGSPNDGASYSDPTSSYGVPDNNSNPDQNVSGEQMNGEAPLETNSAPAVRLYRKDGAVYSARDYWLADGNLHFTVDNGVEFSFDINQLDVQRTVDENARSGVQVILKPGPTDR